MNRYSVRGVMPRRFAASAVDSQLISVTAREITPLLRGSRWRQMDSLVTRIATTLRGPSTAERSMGAPARAESMTAAARGLDVSRSIVRRRALPSGRAVTGGFLMALAALGV